MPSRQTAGVAHTGPRALLVGVAAASFVACTSVSQGGGETSLMDATGTKASTEALRASQSVLLIQVPGAIEASADAMAAETTDPVLRRRALMWKIEVVPAYYQALFNPDPLAGVLDAWALSVQIENYLETGLGSAWKPSVLTHALAGAKKVRSDIEVIARQAAKSPDGFQKAQAYVERWAKANPIESTLASRPSILTELAVTASKASDISVFQVVGNLPATVNDIGERLDIYAAYLPRAARWQAALMVDELSDRAEAQQLLATMQSVQTLTARTNLLLSPEALQSAMATATAEVRKERLAAFASIDQLKSETLADVTQQRVAAVAALDAERQAVMVDIAKERVAIFEGVNELRKKGVVDVDELATRIIRRSALVVTALLLLTALLTVLVLRVGPKPKGDTQAKS